MGPSAMEAARGTVHDFEMGRCESRGLCDGELHVQRRATSAGGGQHWEALGDCVGSLESEGTHGLRLSFQVLEEYDEEGGLVYLITRDYDRYLLEFQLLDTSAEEFELTVAMGILKNGRRGVDSALDIRPQKARAQVERILGAFDHPNAPQRQGSQGNTAAEFLSPLRQFKSLHV